MLIAVKAAAEKQPAMRIVEAALAVGREETDRLDELLKQISEDSKQSNNGTLEGVWPLASVLAHQGKMYQRAIDLLEPLAAKLTERRVGNGIEYSPEGLLLYCYLQLKQNEKAKQILDQSLSISPVDSLTASQNPGYGESQLIQMKLAAAQKYTAMKYPLDALRLVIDVKEDEVTQQKANRWSNNGEYFKQQLKEIENQARKQITPEMLGVILTAELEKQSQDSEQSDHRQSLIPLLIELNLKESKNGQPTADCLVKQLLVSVPKKGAAFDSMKELTSQFLSVPLKERTLGQLIVLGCLTMRFNEEMAFQNIVEEILAREDVLSKPPAAPVEPEKATEKESVEKQKAALASSIANAQIERCAIWIVSEHAAKLMLHEQAERLAHFAMQGLESRGISGQKMKLQFAVMQIGLGKKSEGESTLKGLLDELVPQSAQK